MNEQQIKEYVTMVGESVREECAVILDQFKAAAADNNDLFHYEMGRALADAIRTKVDIPSIIEDIKYLAESNG